jgi:glycosyltransferase involved in cell wall biosynthesis
LSGRRLVVASLAAVNATHRAPYDLMGRDRGWDVHIAAPSKLAIAAGVAPKLLDPAPADAAYTLHPLSVRLQGQQRFNWFVGLSRLVRSLGPDAVFVEYDPGSVPVLEGGLSRAPVYAFSVENIARDRLADAREALRALRLKALARDLAVLALSASGWACARGVACISEDGRRIFLEQGWKKRLEVVPLGTDTRAFRPVDARDERRALGLDGRFVVGYFGRVVPEKGVHLLVEAVARLRGEVALLLDMFRNFAPDSYAASVMERVRALGLQDRCVTIDVPHAEVPLYMNCCDVLVLPSLSTERWKEQFGRVLPEAMACEVPVIGSNSGNIPSMIGDAGIVVPEGDVGALAEAIDALRADPARRRDLGARGRKRVEERFSLAAQADALERLIEGARR